MFLYATGYDYLYTLLDQKVDKLIDMYTLDDGRNFSFGPLYLRIFSVRDPDLLFLGTA